jgi:hypothetical protein
MRMSGGDGKNTQSASMLGGMPTGAPLVAPVGAAPKLPHFAAYFASKITHF